MIAHRTHAAVTAAMLALAMAASADLVGAGGAPAGGEPVRRPPRAAARDSGRARLWMEMRNVDLHIDERAVMHLRRLRGEVVSATPGEPAVLDDAGAFTVRVTAGPRAPGGRGVWAPPPP